MKKVYSLIMAGLLIVSSVSTNSIALAENSTELENTQSLKNLSTSDKADAAQGKSAPVSRVKQDTESSSLSVESGDSNKNLQGTNAGTEAGSLTQNVTRNVNKIGSQSQSGSENNRQTLSQTGTESDTQTQSQTGSENNRQTLSQSGSENKPQTQSQSVTESGTESDTQTQSQGGTGSENNRQTLSQSGSENKPQNQSQSVTESGTESDTSTQSQSETETESKPQTQLQTGSENNPQTLSQNESDNNPQTQTDASLQTEGTEQYSLEVPATMTVNAAGAEEVPEIEEIEEDAGCVLYTESDTTPTEKRYKVTISWGDLTYKYDFGSPWDAETCSYEDDSQGWQTKEDCDGTNNKISIQNESDTSVQASLEFNLKEPDSSYTLIYGNNARESGWTESYFNKSASESHAVCGIFSSNNTTFYDDSKADGYKDRLNLASAKLNGVTDWKANSLRSYSKTIRKNTTADVYFALCGTPDPHVNLNGDKVVGSINIVVKP